MTEIEKARTMWHLLANFELPLSHSDRCQIANVFRATIDVAEQHEAYRQEVSDAFAIVKKHHETLAGIPDLVELGTPFGVVNFPHFILPQPDPDEQLAQEFHDTYESLAPQFGYETRTDTRSFDPRSSNGQLMIATIKALREAGRLK